MKPSTPDAGFLPFPDKSVPIFLSVTDKLLIGSGSFEAGPLSSDLTADISTSPSVY